MRVRPIGSPFALFAAALPLLALVAHAGVGWAQQRPAPGSETRFDVARDGAALRSAHVSLLHSRLDEWEDRAEADGSVRLTAREVRYLRRVSAEIARP